MIEWTIVVSVLVALAIFMAALLALVGLLGTLMMRTMFKKTDNTPGCPIPGCPFAKAMEEAMHDAEATEPEGEATHEAEREKVGV